MANRRDLQRLQALLATLEPQVRKAFIDAIVSARNAIDIAALERALRAGDVSRAVELLRINQAVLFPLDAALTGAYIAGGGMVVETARLSGVTLGFDGRHMRAERWVRDNVAALIREIVEDQAALVRDVIQSLIATGRASRSGALDIAGRLNRATGRREGGLIGLTRRQGQYALSARSELASLDRAYFDRKLRDRRFDSIVRKAIRDGKPISAADIDRITGRYQDRLLMHRAETITRTETITALRAGRREGYTQAVEQGLIRNDLLTRVWDATMDGRTRPDHAAMHGKKVEGTEAPWALPDGSLMLYPGDTSLGASAAQTVQCRCYEEFRVDWLKTANR